MATRTFTESSEDFLNPERGFYVGLNLRSGQGAAAVRASGHSLALAIVRLDDYRTKSLDSAILAPMASR